MAPQATVDRLKKAISEFDREEVGVVCDGLKVDLSEQAGPFPTKLARSILTLLKSKRYFEEMCDVGAALIASGEQDAKVRKLFAQGLIDFDQLPTALDVLEGIVDDPEASRGEVAEAWGLIGRVHKQSYVNQPYASPDKKRQTLGLAIEAYDRIYEADQETMLWHGINVVALLARGQRDGVPVPIDKDYRKHAEDIRETIDEKEGDGNATIWDYSTAMEASVALDDAPAANSWAEKYVQLGLTAAADEFEFGATLRQLQEVWEATPEDFVGQGIVPLLEAALFDVALRDSKGGGAFSIKTAGLRQLGTQLQTKEEYGRLERVFGDDSYKRIQWLQVALDRCQIIGLVGTSTGTGVGTGFVVNGKSLSPNLEDDWYFLTNSHVITNDDQVFAEAPANQKPLRPDQASITFELLFAKERLEFKVKEVVWTSPPNKLDATLLTLDQPFYEGVVPFPVNSNLTDPTAKPRIYIAGHPGGNSLTVSLHDNHLIEFDKCLIRYRTPTNPGSSGSPVFNDEWELVGLHHAGSSKLEKLGDSNEENEANEGIRISAIMEEL